MSARQVRWDQRASEGGEGGGGGGEEPKNNDWKRTASEGGVRERVGVYR